MELAKVEKIIEAQIVKIPVGATHISKDGDGSWWAHNGVPTKNPRSLKWEVYQPFSMKVAPKQGDSPFMKRGDKIRINNFSSKQELIEL